MAAINTKLVFLNNLNSLMLFRYNAGIKNVQKTPPSAVKPEFLMNPIDDLLNSTLYIIMLSLLSGSNRKAFDTVCKATPIAGEILINTQNTNDTTAKK